MIKFNFYSRAEAFDKIKRKYRKVKSNFAQAMKTINYFCRYYFQRNQLHNERRS